MSDINNFFTSNYHRAYIEKASTNRRAVMQCTCTCYTCLAKFKEQLPMIHLNLYSCFKGKGYRPDFRCGKNNVAPNGEIAICDATGTNPCCSFSGWCGSGDNYCECSGCTDFRQQEGKEKRYNCLYKGASLETSFFSGCFNFPA